MTTFEGPLTATKLKQMREEYWCIFTPRCPPNGFFENIYEKAVAHLFPYWGA